MKQVLDKPVSLMYDDNMLQVEAIDFTGFSQGCMQFIGTAFSDKNGHRDFSMHIVYTQPEMSKIQYKNKKGVNNGDTL